VDKQPFFDTVTNGYTFKVLVIGTLVLFLLFPIAMIRNLIRERGRTAQAAEAEILDKWGGVLIAEGPFVLIPGMKNTEIRSKTEKDGEKVEIRRTPFTLMLSPRTLNIDADFKTETRSRGIFSVPLFHGTLSFSGRFDTSIYLPELLPDEELFFNQAEIVIALSGQKGIRAITRAEFDNAELFFQPGNRGYGLVRAADSGAFYPDNAGLPAAVREKNLNTANSGRYGGGIHAAIPNFRDGETAFDIRLDIQGGREMRVLPIGRDTGVRVRADWPSPSFQGSFLPAESAVADSGFEARWDISYLSRDIPLFLKDFDAGGYDFSASLLGVNFFRAIDNYALNTRAVKYAILFLIVPFLTLFLLEVFTKKRIHPVPYLLSGLGNAVFYLLLLSLSEQIPFYTAYLAAALAVTLMMTLYSRSLLPSRKESWYMGPVVAVSYILLYAVLNAESYALLIGSVGTFTIIALVMFLTRKLDWYGRQTMSN
jgi:inner membrane protein